METAINFLKTERMEEWVNEWYWREMGAGSDILSVYYVTSDRIVSIANVSRLCTPVLMIKTVEHG